MAPVPKTSRQSCAPAPRSETGSKNCFMRTPCAGRRAMPKRPTVDLREDQRPLLDVVSYGRSGLGRRSLSKAEIAHIARTARRTPEVVVKVSGGARSLRGVAQHLEYIGREGRGEVHTDDGCRLQRNGFEN